MRDEFADTLHCTVIPAWVVRDKSISVNLRLLYCIVATYDGVLPDQEELADMMHTGPKTVSHWMNELVSSNLISWHQDPTGRYVCRVNRAQE